MIVDSYYFEDKLHGPQLCVYPEGTYHIAQNENDINKSEEYFKADGTPDDWFIPNHLKPLNFRLGFRV